MTQATIDARKLAGELNELWASRARETKGQTVLLRACSMTLLVASEDGAESDEMRRLVGGLMRKHPLRAILIRIEAGAAEMASVFAECGQTIAGNEQICSEGVEIVADEGALADVAREIAPLVSRDLPAMLWCRGSRVFRSHALDPLFPLARKIIVDSLSASDPMAATEAVEKMPGRVADLAWTRVTRWREALAHRIERDAIEPSAIRSASIRYSGKPAAACARYLERWVLTAVPQARVTLEPVAGDEGIREIAIHTDGAEVKVSAADARGASLTEAELIGAELAITGADPVFEKLREKLPGRR